MKINPNRLLCIENLAVVIKGLVAECLPEPNMLMLNRKFSKLRVEILRRLPDGIRYGNPERVLIKFNFASQPSEDDYKEVLNYYYECLPKYQLHQQTVQTVMVSSQCLSSQTLEHFGYDNQPYPGVHVCQNRRFAHLPLISLDELALKPHNAWFKCFASQPTERKKAYEILQQTNFGLIPMSLEPLLSKLAFQPDVKEISGQTEE